MERTRNLQIEDKGSNNCITTRCSSCIYFFFFILFWLNCNHALCLLVDCWTIYFFWLLLFIHFCHIQCLLLLILFVFILYSSEIVCRHFLVVCSFCLMRCNFCLLVVGIQVHVFVFYCFVPYPLEVIFWLHLLLCSCIHFFWIRTVSFVTFFPASWFSLEFSKYSHVWYVFYDLAFLNLELSGFRLLSYSFFFW